MKRKTLDGKEMTSRKQAHLYIAKKLGFPDYYGCNLDALSDCLGEIGVRTKITLKNYREFEENLGAYSKGFVRVFEDAAAENENIIFKCE